MDTRCSAEQTGDADSSSMWNLSDIGTKPLGAKRLRLLLHEIGVSTHEGKIHCGPGRVRTAIFKAWRWKVERR